MAARVIVAAYPNQPFSGEVVKIEPQAILEQNVTMFAVLVSIQNPHGLLKPGMNAEVEVSVARREDVLTVPVMALRTHRDLATTAQLLDIDEQELRNLLGESQQQDPPPAAPRPQADYRFGGRFWVVIDEAGTLRPSAVQTGVTDLERVEIVAGLEEAERVLILPSAHLVETQQRLQEFVNRRASGVPGIGR
jgi:HlyD family secretion protein